MRHTLQYQTEQQGRGRGPHGMSRLRHLRAGDVSPLARLLLFSGVDRRHLRTLAASADIIDVTAGRVVASVGQRATELIGILDGRVDAVDAAGRTLRLTSGDHVDGAAVFDRAPRAWTLTARTAATLLVLHPRAVDLAVLDIPGFEWRLRTADERRMGWAERPLPDPSTGADPQLMLR